MKLWYPTKAAWAAAQAAEHEQAATVLRGERGGDWRARTARESAIAHHEREAARFRRIAGRQAA